MQHSDDRPTTSGRPSLLSTEQQAEADRHRILSGLDAKPAGTTAGAAKARRGKFTWVVVGAAVLALGAGSMVWLTSEGEKEIVLAGTAPLPSEAAPAVALAEPPMASPKVEEVSTATILDDTPMVASESPPKPAKSGPDELTKLLDPQGAPVVVAKPAPAPVRVAAKPPVKKPVVLAKAPAKAAVKPRVEMAEMAMNVQPVVKKKPAAKKAVVQTDTDVALLAALVAHSKAKEPKRGTPGAKLQQCKTLGSVAEAEQCRARLCASTAKKESECKAPSLAKASSET